MATQGSGRDLARELGKVSQGSEVRWPDAWSQSRSMSASKWPGALALVKVSPGPAPSLVLVTRKSQPQAWGQCPAWGWTPQVEAPSGPGRGRDASVTWSPQSPACR